MTMVLAHIFTGKPVNEILIIFNIMFPGPPPPEPSPVPGLPGGGSGGGSGAGSGGPVQPAGQAPSGPSE